MSTPVHETGNSYAHISSTGGNVSAAACTLCRIFVSAASSTPTITVYDDPSTGTTTKLIDTFTPAAATSYVFGVRAAQGLNVVLGGTVSATVVYDTNSSA